MCADLQHAVLYLLPLRREGGRVIDEPLLLVVHMVDEGLFQPREFVDEFMSERIVIS